MIQVCDNILVFWNKISYLQLEVKHNRISYYSEQTLIFCPKGALFLESGPFKWCADKMPTGQNANRTKCQPKVGILSRLFIVVGILSVPIFGWHFVRNISTCFGPLSES